ncbi:MAG: hypothetical protein Q7S43_02890 [bacterium]|nr:hypothetical protein [bacterium]MDO8496376.1 hypothetical protein [bacterium]
MTFLVLLRDLEKNRTIIEKRIETDDWTEESLESPEYDVLREFTMEASQVSIPHNNVDVYIGWWINQGDIEIPYEFFTLIADKKWKVTLDIND